MSSDEGVEAEAILRAIRQEIAQNTKDAPTVPGVYRLPCGSCYVDFFVSAEGEERWLVPGDEGPYTRENIAVARHGPYPWARLYTLAEAAKLIQRALADGAMLPDLIRELELAEQPLGETEDEEIARIVWERTAADPATSLKLDDYL